MSKQTVVLRVPIDDDWDAGCGLQVFTDFGEGQIDTDRPLCARPIEVFPGAVASRGFGVGGFCVGRYGDDKPGRPHNDTFGMQIWGVTPFCNGSPFVEIPVSVPAGFGAWKFAVQSVDRNGNPQSGELKEISAVVSGTEPAPLRSFSFAGHDSETDRVTFDFVKGVE